MGVRFSLGPNFLLITFVSDLWNGHLLLKFKIVVLKFKNLLRNNFCYDDEIGKIEPFLARAFGGLELGMSTVPSLHCGVIFLTDSLFRISKDHLFSKGDFPGFCTEIMGVVING